MKHKILLTLIALCSYSMVHAQQRLHQRLSIKNNLCTSNDSSHRQVISINDQRTALIDSIKSVHKNRTHMRSLNELKSMSLMKDEKQSVARTTSVCYFGANGKELVDGVVRYYQELLLYKSDGGYYQFLNEVDVNGNFLDSIGKGIYSIKKDSFYYKFHSKRSLQNDMHPEVF